MAVETRCARGRLPKIATLQRDRVAVPMTAEVCSVTRGTLSTRGFT